MPTQHHLKELCAVIGAARTPAELRNLLAALLTPAEITAIADRWQIVRRLLAGETQRAVRDALGVGIATVERGAREIHSDKGILQEIYARRTHP